MGKFGIGQAVERVEDTRLLTGRGRYTDDIDLDNQAYAVVLRSPHAHAEIRAIDTSPALAVPGVLAVYTAADIKAAGLGTLPCVIPLKQVDGSPLVTPPRPLLAEGRVRHVGDPVAFVVAESVAQANAAAALVEVDYAPLAAVASTKHATDSGAPQIWDAAPGNRCFVWADGDAAAVDAAFASADRAITLELVNNRIIVNPMETRAAIGAWDGKRFTLYTPSQGPHGIRGLMARNVFNMSSRDFRVVTTDVGGGFGMKIFLYAEQPLVLFAARALGRPVKWTAERSADGFVSDSQGRDHVTTVELALDKDGKFLGMRVRTLANLGAYLSNYSPFVATDCGTGMLAGVYTTPAIHVQVTGVFTNTVPIDAYRGAGRPEAIYVIERLVDFAAREIGMDPAALRRRNFIPPDAMPFKTGMKLVYDSGKFARNLDAALRMADRDGFAKRKAASARNGRLRGLGHAYYVEACGFGVGDAATVRIERDGGATVLVGNQSNGQGHETAYSQIVADRLGIDIGKIRVLQGDTDVIGRGSGTGGSRALAEGGVACLRATETVIEKGRQIAADKLEAAAADIEYDAGLFRVAGTDRVLTLAEAAAAAPEALSADDQFKGEVPTFPNGCHVCEVEIERDTGRMAIVGYTVVDDFGTVVNPSLLRGQVHGGVGQGIGQAAIENCVYDPGSGQLISGSFMDYALPRAADLPALVVDIKDDVPCRTNPLGIKGAGEAGAVGAPPAVINAVVDALSDLGVHHIDMPATPEKIWRAIQGAA
ncbi:MAG: molybdopterin-dependent oxidoreductase [Alphaproteobacteria bacterium]|nr:molybdopterin-dependent oxidoreductase [Alphaproteobacteria bacterium]